MASSTYGVGHPVDASGSTAKAPIHLPKHHKADRSKSLTE
jgi:hypothetical protein